MSWDVLIIGGASGSGKTSISRPLSQLYGVDLLRVDDFQCLLEAIISPERVPDLHYWKIEPNWRNQSVEWVVERLKSVSQAWLPGLAAVIKDRMEEKIPMILEGDFILPELAAAFDNPRIKTIFVHEPSREQIYQNYLSREGTHQAHRADISHAFGNWLKERCEEFNVPVFESRPWASLLERVGLGLGLCDVLH
jgi:2-phosphoglycerate kinase